MIIIHDTKEFDKTKSTAITIGKFDGVHIGHQLLIADVCSKVDEGLSSLVFSFTNSPRQYIDHTVDQMILSKDERRSVIEDLGVDYFAEVPFNDEFMKLSPGEFLNLLIMDLNMKHLCVGDDFRFGYKGQGDVLYLQKKSDELGFSLRVVEKVKHKDNIISSTYIRDLITEGNVLLAGDLLRRDYRIEGEVVHGKAIGRTLGIPTINIEPKEDKLLPRFGVYFSTALIEGVSYPSITNIGMKPTVANTNKPIVESHLLDISADLYGKKAEIIFHDKLRDEMKFKDLDELQSRMKTDVLMGKNWFAER